MIWKNSAPSNIALIKYMGKTNVQINIATNPSLSYTLNHLRTFVEVEVIDSASDCWQALQDPGLSPMNLSAKGKQRFLNHAQKLKDRYGFSGHFCIRSGNNFPSDCGLASSASSYAALTKTLVDALAELTGKPALSIQEQAHVSRKTSGSSGRSFFAPWCLWDDESIEAIYLPYTKLLHYVIVVDQGRKAISSSQAHLLVTQSLLFENRPYRARQLLQELIEAMQSKDFEQAYHICWRELWDMHALFETSALPFGYMTPASIEVLQAVRHQWQTEHVGPIVTMDAGPNIHLLYPPEMEKIAETFNQQFADRYLILSSNTAHES